MSLLNSSNIGALATASTLIGSLSNLLLASPQTTKGYLPQNVPGPTGLFSLLPAPPSLLFHYEGEQTATMTSDITDHFTEDNTAIQDQIALKPVVVTTHGFIGELNDVPPPALALLQDATNTLSTIDSYVPGLSVTAQLAYNNAFASYQLTQSAVNAGVSAISSLTGSGGTSVIGAIGEDIASASNQNLQQTYFQQLYGYWQNRTLFTIQTPWAIFQNMAILSLRAIQDDQTRMITDFEISFKQMNFASTAVNSTGLQGSGRNLAQSALNVAGGTGALNSSIGVGAGLKSMGAL